MEAMTQEFMLHRRPHVEIWSAREGSNDDTSRIHFSNQSLMDPNQSQLWTFKGSSSETTKVWRIPTNNHKKGSISETKIWWIPNPTQTMRSKGPFQKQKSDGFFTQWPTSETNIWWVITNPNVHNWSTPKSDGPNNDIPKHRCSSLYSITHPIKK